VSILFSLSLSRIAKTIDDERKVLLPLPNQRAIDYVERRVVVSNSSTIVRRVTYTVPSRLQGECLNVKIYDDQLVCYLGSQHVVTLQRLQSWPRMWIVGVTSRLSQCHT